MEHYNILNSHIALEKWREERHLTSDKQLLGLKENLWEEFSEFILAKKESEEVDALMDICVFLINSYGYKMPSEINIDESKRETFEALDKEQIELKLFNVLQDFIHAKEGNIPNYNIVLLKKMFEYIVNVTTFYYRYDFSQCLEETIKEISSRTGEWNEDRAKFIKYSGTYKTKEELLVCPNGDIPNEMNGWTSIDEHPDMFIIKRDNETIGCLRKWYQANYEKCRIIS